MLTIMPNLCPHRHGRHTRDERLRLLAARRRLHCRASRRVFGQLQQTLRQAVSIVLDGFFSRPAIAALFMRPIRHVVAAYLVRPSRRLVASRLARPLHRSMAAAQLVRRGARTVAGTGASTTITGTEPASVVRAALLAAGPDYGAGAAEPSAGPSGDAGDSRNVGNNTVLTALLNLPTLLELSINQRRRENEEPLDLTTKKKKK
ncbi:hypothetical protein DAPPUDRAFT_251423 [Daphnia pulex]|uniref:Uncharacterized protein n=1 Tax=Daphnia pulex TaxID=6669 RepID=E9H0E8_DAPPU|nr:hypothetical protein DAPPUDRAFT_251423 [Daphnia pulex]|eukprot:EFX74795.1 hypothetical protein DAPPUDRAFT_251423 [Daphnia pulex]